MCDPLTIGAGVAMVAGAYLSKKGADEAQHAREEAVGAENDRQVGYQRQQGAIFDNTLGKFDRTNQDQTQAKLQDTRGAALDSAVNDRTDPSVGVSGSAPQEVKDSVAGALNRSITRARTQGANLAKLKSFGDLNFGNVLDLNRSGIDQGRLGNFSAGSNNVLPLELSAANQKGAGLRQFGQLLQLGGQVAGMGGAMGAGAGLSNMYDGAGAWMAGQGQVGNAATNIGTGVGAVPY